MVLAIWLLVVAIYLGNYGALIKSKRNYFGTSDYFADADVDPLIQVLNNKLSNTVIATAVSAYIKLLKVLFWLWGLHFSFNLVLVLKFKSNFS